ncbi:MAG: symmetrical bis(5'-nucleosyl)-tetraphosphatase [Gammaproteobacteria bacterium]|nr:symmetrical bis(5'-nucleosyl)-tetraphosphatase [Gammaproteobacteria bacterium]
MTTYVIGDVQGCHAALLELLDKLRFDRTRDQLWFAGDLVNRGPDSLAVLRFVRDLGDCARCVLGNHDLHLLAVYAGHRKIGSKDTLGEVLAAPDLDELIDWLRRLPLLISTPSDSHVLTHAGLHPAWDLATAKAEARFVESRLQNDDFENIFPFMYGNTPIRWKPGRGSKKRLRFAINCFTRMRFCTLNGELDFEQKGSPGSQPKNLVPWFDVPERKNRELKIIFGHWSTLGRVNDSNVIAIDSGCVWGGYLTAYQLETDLYSKVSCPAARLPGSD